MAIFRSRGGSSFTSCLPIRISPPVGFSSPAIIRRRVVFPQPDGPKRTRSSPSCVERSTPSTALTSPKCFRTARVSTVAIPDSFSKNQRGRRLLTSEPPPVSRLRSRSGRLDEPLLLPLAEDPLARRVTFLEGLFWARGAAPRPRPHDVENPGDEDLGDGPGGATGVADVGCPLKDVVEHLVLVRRVALGVVSDELLEIRHAPREAGEVVVLASYERLAEVGSVVNQELLCALDVLGELPD